MPICYEDFTKFQHNYEHVYKMTTKGKKPDSMTNCNVRNAVLQTQILVRRKNKAKDLGRKTHYFTAPAQGLQLLNQTFTTIITS